MSAKTAIEWTDSTWNPIRARNIHTGKVGWHCEHATTGCEHCYAEGMNKRLGTGLPFKPGHRKDVELFLDEEMLTQPLRWKKPRMIFVCSMIDLFADFVPDEWIDRIFAVMALCPQYTFQVLTKRAARMRDYVTARIAADKRLPIAGAMNMMGAGASRPIGYRGWPLPNVWLGVSTERQQEYDERKEHLRNTPAAVRFFSMEPLLGPIVADWLGDLVIVGGESGPRARPMHPDWPRALLAQSNAMGAAFFFKQWGEYIPHSCATWDHQGAHTAQTFGKSRLTLDGEIFWRSGKKAAGRLLDGIEHNAMPKRQSLLIDSTEDAA